ncbi:1-acyl-sn-glycerol-3-phosphate acyltransferase gamma-like [Drosophila novamexicana]|uniref:1-acyl-sn-glycerol-3-phosphate acyltransferase gamma-like n=1 Tax=Drosophila novamexicana TaxID=47314 RepID=UPI0011E5F533|nr:1-acyl-sn-glycerol-3-phosphate acyltransferase gamma-like [Drosophila novamexicana]
MITLEELKKLRLIHLCIAITFFTSGLTINFAQLLLHICLKPFNKHLFRKLMYYLCYSFYCQLVFVADWYAGCKLRVYMDADDAKKYAGKEHVLLMMNHKYEIDWLAGWMICDKVGVLGNCKAYAKKAIRYVPCMGWAWWLAEFVFLNRDFDKDKEIIAKQLKIVYSYPDPTWLLLNAEGTRFTPEKHEASVKFALERGMTPLKHHLIPRTKGFTASLPALRGICPVIYDINLAFKADEKTPPTMLSLLNGKGVEPYMLMRRIPLEQVPEGEKEAAEWLQKLFVEKDRIIDSFYETGSFFEKSGVKEVPFQVCKPRLSSLLNFAGWATYSLSLIIYYLITCLLASNWTGLITALSVLAIFYWLMGAAINKTQISKGSNYGSQSAKPSTH